jgi:PiT family inorganic phosphate transporter
MDPLFVVALVVVIALFFDFTNGFHDTANAMATPIATGALKPRVAVAIAAIMNIVGAFLSTAVAKTISVDLINSDVQIIPQMVFAGLTGAILWNLTTWFLGLPSSSSHALFGGLIGAAITYSGFNAVNFGKMIEKVFIPALFAPVIAGLVAFAATKVAYALTYRSADGKDVKPTTGRGKFRIGQIFSSSLVALSHGTNDAQKTMGVITLVLVGANLQSSGDYVQTWVIISAALAIGLGTYSGGWRIIKTMGTGLSEIRPVQGLSAETSTGVTILASSNLGFALSTTQVASGSVIGAGLGRPGGAVRWNKAGQVVLGWLLTLPAAALVGAASAALTKFGGDFGLIADGILTVAVVVAIFQISNRNKVAHHNVLDSEVSTAGDVVKTARQRRKEAFAVSQTKKKSGSKTKSSKSSSKSSGKSAKKGKK